MTERHGNNAKLFNSHFLCLHLYLDDGDTLQIPAVEVAPVKIKDEQ